jgi:hypothetical protein
VPVDVRKASGFPIRQLIFPRLRLETSGGIASNVEELTSRKGRAFPHIRRQSRWARHPPMLGCPESDAQAASKSRPDVIHAPGYART